MKKRGVMKWSMLAVVLLSAMGASAAEEAAGPAMGARAADEAAADPTDEAQAERVRELLEALAAPVEKPSEGLQVAWVAGPTRVDLHGDLAEIEVPEGFLFAGPEDTRKLLSSMGNRAFGSEVGMIVPESEDEDWFLVFDWEEVGYVKDDEKDSIDADALLESLQASTLEGNAWRRENGIPDLTMTGWAEAPHYDQTTHNLVWATQLESADGRRTVNYNVRVLGRRGLMSVTLVEREEGYAAAKPAARKVLDGFAFKTGNTYAEWTSGDKVAEYGLTALVAAGAGAAAVKLGFFGMLAKFFGKAGKMIVLAVVALAATARGFVKRLFGRREEE